MNVILALACLFVFFLSLAVLFTNVEKMASDLILKNQKNDLLRAAYEAAKQQGDSVTIEAARKAYHADLGSGCASGLKYLWSGCVGKIFQWILTFVKIFIIVAALSLHIGNPIVGFISLVIWTSMLIYGLFIEPAQILRAANRATDAGNIYLPTTNWIAKIVDFLPSVYALYVFLIIIGVISSVMG